MRYDLEFVAGFVEAALSLREAREEQLASEEGDVHADPLVEVRLDLVERGLCPLHVGVVAGGVGEGAVWPEGVEEQPPM